MATQKMNSNSDPGFPPLFSDEEFENLQQRRNDVPSPEQDRVEHQAVVAPRPTTDGRPESTIEQRFTHVSQQLVAMWPSEACAMYIQRLVISDRGSRQGFPQDVVDDLMMLYQINEMLYRKSQRNIGTPEGPPASSAYAEVTKSAFNWNFIAENKFKER